MIEESDPDLGSQDGLPFSTAMSNVVSDAGAYVPFGSYIPYLYNNTVSQAAMDVASSVLASSHPKIALGVKAANYIGRAYRSYQNRQDYRRNRDWRTRVMSYRRMAPQGYLRFPTFRTRYRRPMRRWGRFRGRMNRYRRRRY